MADLQAELQCSICLGIFKDPVTLRCGHNFCQECITQALDIQVSRAFTCPKCRKRFRSRPVLNKNTNLSNIAEQFRCAELEDGDTRVLCNFCDLSFTAIKTCLQCETSMCERHLRNHDRSVQHTLLDPTTSLENRKCPIHKKLLGYYCTTDDTCICLSCSLGKEHREHQVEPLNEASEKKKERLRKVLETMNSKTEEIERKVQHLQEDMREDQEKADVVTRRVHDRFRLFTRQLQVLEETLISDIMIKKEQSLRSYTDQIQELEKENEKLLRSKCHLEELCHVDDPYTILQDPQSGVGGVCDAMEGELSGEPSRNAGGLNVHLLSKTLQIGLYDIMLGLDTWFYKQKPADLSLDVNSAAPNLQVSDDLKTVSHMEPNKNLLGKAERYESNQVISTRHFSSGRHYWEVEAGDSGNWGVGVCYPSTDRRGAQSGQSWCLWRGDNGLVVEHHGRSLQLQYRTSCNSVRVYLDYTAGRLSFYELSDPVRHLYTFSATFIEPLHADFMVHNNWLRIKNRDIVRHNA